MQYFSKPRLYSVFNTSDKIIQIFHSEPHLQDSIAAIFMENLLQIHKFSRIQGPGSFLRTPQLCIYCPHGQ